ncbi:hypothetical protein QWY29_18430 [Nocardioides sp. SOB72]|uniref:Uncharacterized protein n=1 Tax=Nocardioides abyssi TaxID=3058370 RepID=A0ABT8EZ45_9ACTN|nr:hypothetical protein [Nocardioides abyssi]MDN4163354.1 hypothetical protein [Nocardioides abyssi]
MSAKDEPRDLLRCRRRDGGLHVAVGIGRQVHRGVSEAILDDLHGDPGLEGVGRVRVSDVVEPDDRKSCTPSKALQSTVEKFRSHRPAIGAGEDVVVVGPADHAPALLHRAPVDPEHVNGRNVEQDVPLAARRLRTQVIDPRPRLDALIGDQQAGLVHVDVCPPQTRHLAAPQACHRGEVESGVQVVVAGEVQEVSELGRRPRDAVAGRDPRKFDMCRRVERQLPALDRVVERAVQGRLDPLERPRTQGTTGPRA